MFIDYDYYKNIYNGNKISKDGFNKQAIKACNLISDETMTRVNDLTIDNYPLALINVIKTCACELAEKYSDYDKIYSNIVGISSGNNQGNLKSESAGYAKIEYGYSEGILKKFSSPSAFKEFLLETIHDYLRPQQIDGIVWNLTSKVLKNGPCCCNII